MNRALGSGQPFQRTQLEIRNSEPCPNIDVIEKQLRELSAVIFPSEEAAAEFDEFLEHNEFELALETLTYAVAVRADATAHSIELINAIAAAMSLDGNAILAEMRRRARIRKPL